MKKEFLIFIILIFSSSYLFAKISAKKADQLVFKYIKTEKISDGCWLYAIDSSFARSSIEKMNSTSIKTDSSSWVYFVDEQPFANWSHNCRYLFVNKESGKITSKPDMNPPKDIEKWRMLTNYPELPEGKKFNLKNKQSMLKSGLVPSKCYAVIISGGANAYNNWVRYWNDCEAIYSALVNVYGYLDSHIYVLISDGTSSGNDRHLYDGTYDSSPLDLDGDGDNDIQYSATKSNISSVFNTLSGILDSDDFLFIYTTDHGGLQSGDDVYINLWGETMNDDEFATEVDKVSAGSISVVMEQCYSGGFVSDLSASGRTIATACSASESSYAMSPSYIYDEFVFHWTAAVAGEDPDGNTIDADENDDGYVSMQEAFNYAESEDVCSETPQYNSTYHWGYYLTLLGTQACTTNSVDNTTITSDETVIGCKISAENTTIQNNSDVIFQYSENVTLLGSFIVSLGSTLSIDK
jgi:hypothetical protein